MRVLSDWELWMTLQIKSVYIIYKKLSSTEEFHSQKPSCGQNVVSSHLDHLLGDLLASPHGLHQGPGGYQGPLDIRGELSRNVSEGSQTVNIVRHAGKVETVETVLSVQNLEHSLLVRWRLNFEREKFEEVK